MCARVWCVCGARVVRVALWARLFKRCVARLQLLELGLLRAGVSRAHNMNAFEQLAEGQRKLAEHPVSSLTLLPGFHATRGPLTASEVARDRVCLLERTTTKAIRVDKTQTRLDGCVRPTAWTKAPMDLTPDALVHVVEMLMASGDARALRALAVACRATASAVATALGTARRLLQRKAAALVDARHAATGEAIEATKEEEFVQAMTRAGILDSVRQRALVVNAHRVFFHDARSLLGHIQNACEFCSTALVVRVDRPAGPVALWACDKCAHQHRVQFSVDKYPKEYGEAVVVHGRTQVQVRIPRREGPAYNYACAMLSKRNAHHRRMRARRASEVGSLRLIRRVHMTEFTPVMHASWEVHAHNGLRGNTVSGRIFIVADDYLRFELWHALPAGIPSNLTFAAVLGLKGNDEMHSEAQREARKHAHARLQLVKRRKAYNKIVEAQRWMIGAMRGLIRPGGYHGWIQIIDVCIAARAFDVRWIFHEIATTTASLHCLDWRLSRYRILDSDEVVRARAFARLRVVIEAVQTMLTLAGQSWTSDNRTRACIVEIIKRLPISWLDAGDPAKLTSAAMTLRKAPMTVTCVLPTPPSTLPVLKTIVRLDNQLFGRKNLVLETVLSRYDRNRLVKACNHYDQLGDPPGLHQLVDIASRLANATTSKLCGENVAERRDEIRVVLFGMAGAWPRLDTPP